MQNWGGTRSFPFSVFHCMFFIFHSPAHDECMPVLASLTAWLVAALIALPLIAIAAAVVYKVLRRSPRKRPETAGLTAEQLRRLQETQPAADEPPSLHYLFAHRILP